MSVPVLTATGATLRRVDAAFLDGRTNVSVNLDYLPAGDPVLPIERLLEDVVNPVLPWLANHAHAPGFGFNPHSYWFRLAVDNSTQRQLERLLEIRNPVLDEVLFYQVDAEGNIVNLAQTGDRRPVAERPFFHHNLVLPFEIAPGQSHVLLFRVTTTGSLEFPLEMWTPEAFQQRDQIQLLFYGAMFGILAVMGVYNFFIYTLFRDWSFVYYAGFSVSMMLFEASIHGFSAQYLWPASEWWRNNSLVVIIPVIVLCAVQFSVVFLQLRLAYPRLMPFIQSGNIACLIMLGLVPFLEYAVLIRICAALVFPICLLAIALGVHRWLNGYKPARYFVIAWSVFLLAIAYYSLAKFGLFERTELSESAVQIGVLLDTVLLAFALADRMNSQRKSFMHAQNKALELQRAVNEELELRVEERTQALRQTMGDLEQANHRLQALTMQDGLTGIRNRRYFDDKLTQEWQRAIRSRDSLALLLIDIDFFKSFNDKYGHLVGDECLKRVAQAIDNAITRPSDAVARYGGEEFAVILPETGVEGALHVAENIRLAVERVRIEVGEARVQVSVSIGVAILVPDEGRASQDLILVADQALYDAKSAGRNRTRLAQTIQRH
ncbi:MAG: GGDEF domain-containing protein [Gammaproteobacteria bacterium]|nr:GGDEF domain-containing protein [Gammaproteobacteria bacterium]